MKDNKLHILIADDEKEIRDVLSLLLTGNGYAVTAVENGSAVLSHAGSGVDLYILDVNMPGLNGLAAAAGLRSQCDTPILFLTAYSGESDKIMGFAAGADDYVVKPFSNAELLMRIKAILRRSAGSAPTKASANQVVVEDLVLDLDSQTVLKNGQSVPLTFTEFQILALLASHRKKIFSLENIYDSIWNDNAVGDSAIMVHIKNIRKKLGDDSRNPVYIKTAWGKGYYID